MYIGRIVSVGKSENGQLSVMYRVSSRSFPNREIVKLIDTFAVMPKKGYHEDAYKNPYISYNCCRTNERYAVVANGTHADPIFEKLLTGMDMRDAIGSVLLAMDYEHDQLSTPRIVAITDRASDSCALGSIRHDGLSVEVFQLQPSEFRFVSTYEKCIVSTENGSKNFSPLNEKSAAQFIINGSVFSEFDNPISAVAALANTNGYKTAVINL
ncbi:IMP cyclohydrolase [Psychromonas algicola]|uniref:IMP cyclohydrolase n=1 Tax=Psychromonas algicola TaxID=2555642 RepID=UPI001067E3CB|nr:IMP cyclohydrolase [Psychromonas sp. RZ5]TEW51844.1 IMP cyclohydrolase [Psychromonas sp. RZ5]